MSQFTRCEGCAISAPLGQEEAADIRVVRLLVSGHDARDWAQRRDEQKNEAHLCHNCRRDVLEQYFGQDRPAGSLAAPGFLRQAHGAS